MFRLSLILVALCTGSLCAVAALRPSAPVDQATLGALATRYTFASAGALPQGCIVTLSRGPALTKPRLGFAVTINAACRRHYPSLKAVARWEPTGGGSLRLLGGSPLHELSDFSPVQDASGVYLRGGFDGERTVYQLRPPQ
jgi:hypothetical protein